MSEFKINLNDIHLYTWEDLYWFEYEVTIGFWAMRNLISYQEEVYGEKQVEFISNRGKVLPTVPEEHRESYEQHFFEDADRTFEQLKYIQRNSVCLSFFSFMEGKLLELIKLMEKQFDIPYRSVRMEILKSINKYFVNECKVDGSSFKVNFRRILKQSIIRNAIAHNQSVVSNIRRFTKEEGIILKGNQAVIEDVVYLNNLILWGEEYFKQLFIAIDIRLTKIKSKAK